MSRRGSLGYAEGQNAKKQNGDEMMNDVVTNTVVKNAARSCTLDKIAPLKQRACCLHSLLLQLRIKDP